MMRGWHSTFPEYTRDGRFHISTIDSPLNDVILTCPYIADVSVQADTWLVFDARCMRDYDRAIISHPRASWFSNHTRIYKRG